MQKQTGQKPESGLEMIVAGGLEAAALASRTQSAIRSTCRYVACPPADEPPRSTSVASPSPCFFASESKVARRISRPRNLGRALAAQEDNTSAKILHACSTSRGVAVPTEYSSCHIAKGTAMLGKAAMHVLRTSCSDTKGRSHLS